MGYMCHHAIIVTGWDVERVRAARDRAEELNMSVTNIVGPVTNGYHSFLVGPDGSKEGWDESDRGNRNRTHFIRYMDASSVEGYLNWAEVQYGDEEGNNKLLRDSGQSDRQDWQREAAIMSIVRSRIQRADKEGSSLLDLFGDLKKIMEDD